MISLYDIQAEIHQWAQHNFGDHPGWHPLLGLAEEVGELSHSYLKREQFIRGDFDKHTADIQDAVGDITIFLMDFCNTQGIDFETQLQETWDKVKQRDWTNEGSS